MSEELRRTISDTFGAADRFASAPEIADAIIAALGLMPVFTAKLSSGGGQAFATLKEAQDQHQKNIERLGQVGDPMPLAVALERGEAFSADEDAPPRVYADGVYVQWETPQRRIGQ